MYERLSKKKHELDKLRPFPDALIRNLEDWFRVELTYSSNAIEGNTLTRRETALVVEKGLTVGGKTLKEHLEAVNHAHALDFVKSLCAKTPRSLTENDILSIHGLILKGIDDANAGRYRDISVRIAGSAVVFPNYGKVPDLMAKFVGRIQDASDTHPVELASLAHYELLTIHPFVDGNGRTSRLLMNLILLMHGYPPAIIGQKDRLTYITALQKAQLGGSMDDFSQLIARQAGLSLDMYLQAAKGETARSLDVATPLLKIGELAKRTNETQQTIRYWTQEGLLDIADTTASGYNLYDAAMTDRVKKIKDLKEKRLTLKEIKACLNNNLA